MTNFCFENLYQDYDKFIHGSKIDLSGMTLIDPWGIAFLCLKIARNHSDPEFDLVLPKDKNSFYYLKRAHLEEFLLELGLVKYAHLFDSVAINEKDNPNIQEIYHCQTKDVFGARLGKFLAMYRNFGLNDSQAQYMTAIIGEIGNNVFDHNLGNWPLDVTGAIIMGQRYPKKKELNVIVADPGIGFKQSLHRKDPNLKDQIEAIKLALQKGVSGRIEEARGNGLKYVQDWTFDQLSGTIMIQSYDGLVIASKKEIKGMTVPSILGTIVEVKITY